MQRGLNQTAKGNDVRMVMVMAMVMVRMMGDE
jgi:hypothetical protein